jgi:hypothetical protein
MNTFRLRITQADIDSATAYGPAFFPCPFDFACERLQITAKWSSPWITLSNDDGLIGRFLMYPLTRSKVWDDYRNAKPKTIIFNNPFE